ncbi:MAG: hypothetical protein QGG36_03240 [Pirellulaceae bacterium]|nr:hypothetical protein [Pirellulaceae bacterium]
MQHHRGIWERLRRWRRRAQRGPLRAPAVLEAGPLEDRILYSASPVGSETVANATTSGDQKDPSVGVADNGDFVVVWEGDDSDKDGVYFQRFDSSGTAQGGETLANAEEKDDQKDPVVAVDADGDFVVVWQGNGPGDSKGVFLRRYDETGTALSGDVLVNTTTSGDQEEPAIAMASDGDFVVVWEGDDADKKGVYLQAFDSSGSRVGSETLVNVTTSGDQKDPRVGMADDDSFVVVWSGNGTGDSKGVFARAFNNVGGTLSGEVLVNTTTANDEKTPDVAVDTDGDFIVVWQGDDADKKGIFAQRYDSTGAAVGGETAINQTTSGDQKDPRVALDDDGDFVVVWRGNGTGDGDGVFARQYDSATGFEAEELVNTTTSGKQERPDVAITSDGDFIAVWEGDDADKNGVFFQRFENAAPVVDLNGAAAGGDHSASFVEDGGAVRIADTNATVVDTDDTNLASLTLSLAAIPDGSAETLDANVGGTSISKSYDSGTGVLTLSGSDTVANYQTVLRTVTYDNSSETPNTSDRTLQVVANDGSQDSAEVTTTISVVSTNDPPAVGSLEGGALAYTENNGAQNVTATAIVGDVDDTTLQSARITIAANFVSGEDVLAFTDTLNISGNYSSGTGVLTLTGSDTIAAYQAALRSITYENTSDNPSTATRTIDFLVNDGSSNSAVASRDIAITAENDNPDIKNLHGDSLSYNIGDGVVVVEQGGDAVVADPDSPNFDGGQLTVSIPTGGVFTEDSLSIRNQGSGMGQIGFAAGVVSYEGAPIGTATIGSTLTVNLNTSATPAALTALAQNVTYENTNAINPTGGARTLRLSLTDGNGGGSGDHDVTLNINVSNQAPVVTNFAGDTLMFAEGGSAAVIDQGDDATVTDADSIDFAGGNVTVSIITGGDPSEDVLSVRHVGNNVGEIGFAGGVVSYSGVAIGAATGGSGSNLVITLNGAATPVATTELLRNITYQNTDGDDPATIRRRRPDACGSRLMTGMGRPVRPPTRMYRSPMPMTIRPSRRAAVRPPTRKTTPPR